jgi:DeoR family transcriptional regulator of aga operon
MSPLDSDVDLQTPWQLCWGRKTGDACGSDFSPPFTIMILLNEGMGQERRAIVVSKGTMSDRSKRQSSRVKSILHELQQAGSVSINDLCERYDASVATIRRDLQRLEEDGRLRRTHGGAVSIEPLFYEAFRKDASFVDLVGRHPKEKRRIGQAAAELIQQGNTIALTPGTTTTEVIRCLRYEGGIKVLTNTVNVAMELSKRKDIEVFVTGGYLRGDWFSLVGPAAVENLRQAYVDIVFIGADGIDPAAGLTCHSADEAAVNRVMIAQARKRVVVVDHSKFGTIASWKMCAVEDCQVMITDKGATKEVLAPYIERGVDVRRV